MVWADVFQAGVLLVGLLAVVIQVKAHLHVSSRSPFFVPFKNGFTAVLRPVLFTHNIKKIKHAAHKNGDVDGKCKRIILVSF